MRITKNQLRQIIKEELSGVLREELEDEPAPPPAEGKAPPSSLFGDIPLEVEFDEPDYDLGPQATPYEMEQAAKWGTMDTEKQKILQGHEDAGTLTPEQIADRDARAAKRGAASETQLVKESKRGRKVRKTRKR